jgi:glycosyltransferase involved in cell wall biosynthesis
MKVLIISQYFWPENFKINDLSEGLSDRGLDISVLTGKPNYPSGVFFKKYSFFKRNEEKLNKIKIYRSPLFPRSNGSGFRLFVNYISFAFFASFRLFFIKQKFDKIFVYEPSPITVGIPAIVAKYRFNAPIYFWVQDLWPESISDAGGIKNKKVIKFVNELTKFIYKNCFKILVQSKAFVPYITKQNINSNKLIYFPNSTESFYKVENSNNKYKKLLPNGFKIIFAGNIGEAQSFETIIKSALYLKNKNININWIILGDGRQKKNIQLNIRKLGMSDSFFFLGSFPTREMPLFFSHADALLVTLKKSKIFSLTIPNKIQSYMACSKPIIASIDGEGKNVIVDSKCGYVSPSEDHILLSKSIIKFMKLSVNERKIMGLNGRKYFEEQFEREKQLDKLIEIFNEK